MADLAHAAAKLTKVPVENRHKQYNTFHEQWKRCRDVMKGKDAVHAAGTAYLPKLAEQTDDEYKAYKMRAGFFNASWRTLVGLQGMLFRQPPKVTVPEAVKELLDDIDLKGTPFVLQILKVTEEALGIGRVGLLVDYPQVDPALDGRLTKADAANTNLRPTIGVYRAESIIDWQTRVINNRTVLSQVRLEECATITKGEFEETEETRWRVLDLVSTVNTENGARSGAYRVRVFRKNERGEQEQVGTDIFPTMEGKVIDFIPFYFIGVDSNSWECSEPPMIDLVDLNLAHYRVSADYEHGCHFTGLPTPYIAGHRAKENAQGVPIEKYYIGSAAAWVFPSHEVKVGFLEFAGQGLTALKANLDDKKAEMAVLGARMLEPQQKQVEAAETAAIHRGGENSMLSSIAQSTSLGVKNALITFCRWAGAAVPDGSDAVEFELNRDFFPVPMKSDELREFVAAWQKGAMSFETMFKNLQRREIFEKDATAEEERDKIDAEGPKMPLPGAVDPLTGEPIAPPGFPGAKPGEKKDEDDNKGKPGDKKQQPPHAKGAVK
jgi:hypothetical protein